MTERSNLVPPVPGVPGREATTGDAAKPAKTGVSPVSPVVPGSSNEQLEILSQAVADTGWSVADLREQLSNDDLADLAAGELTAETLRTFVLAVETRREIAEGRVPRHFTKRAHCDHCGPIFLWTSVEVAGCPWCCRRKAGQSIPRPGGDDE